MLCGAVGLVTSFFVQTSSPAGALVTGAYGVSGGMTFQATAADLPSAPASSRPRLVPAPNAAAVKPPAIAAVSSAVPSAAPSATPSAAPVLNPPAVPANGIYLGVDANYVNSSSVEVQTAAFEQSMGAPVGIASFYVGFLQIPALRQMRHLLETGAVPMINMKCGAPDVAIAAGVYDSQLERLALLLRAFGGPVFFRWFWEMNLSKTGRHAYCLGEAGAEGYIAAYQHIWNIFHAEGAYNVAFVWCPSDANGVPNAASVLFYPGDRYVDWIGADLYDRVQVLKTFGHEFDAFYRFWHTQAPATPIMICETGAIGGGPQRTWLKQIAAALTRKVYMTRDTPFTQVHGVVYVDAVDRFDYILKPGSLGHLQFASLLHQRFFAIHA